MKSLELNILEMKISEKNLIFKIQRTILEIEFSKI